MTNQPTLEDREAALEPCPFCLDPMKRHEVSGIIRHVDMSELNDCVLASYAFTDVERWNTRPTPAPDVVEEICPCWPLDMPEDEYSLCIKLLPDGSGRVHCDECGLPMSPLDMSRTDYINSLAASQPAPDVVEAVPDTDLVCTTCRWRGGHSPDCPRKDEPWPTFIPASQPAPDVAALVEAATNMADLVERLTDAVERETHDIGGEGSLTVLRETGPAYDALRAALTRLGGRT